MNLSTLKKTAALVGVVGAFGVFGVTSAFAADNEPAAYPFDAEVTIESTIAPGPDGLVTDCDGSTFSGGYDIGTHAASPATEQATGAELCIEVGSNVPWTASVALTDPFVNGADTKNAASFQVVVDAAEVGDLTAPRTVATELANSLTSDPIQFRSYGYTEALASTLPAGTYAGELTFTVTEDV